MRVTLAAILALFPSAAFASAFSGLPSARAASPAPQGEGLWADLVNTIYGLQTAFYQAMNASLSDMKADGTAGLYLMLFALLYGFFHAAGPGHGKVVVSSYVLADRLTLKKGIALSFVSALFQGLVAVALISIAAVALRFTQRELMEQAGYLEKASFALIALLGIVVVARATRPMLARLIVPRLAYAGEVNTHSHADGHAHPHAHHHHHHHGHDHGEACGCGHAHMPSATQVKAITAPAEFMAAAFSIGLRPCTGALVVLVFALAQGLYPAGIAAVAVMSLGTAIMVSIIAITASSARDIALRMWGGESVRSKWLSSGLQLCGGLVLFLFGLVMFMGPVQGT